jgi:hypothetical protein
MVTFVANTTLSDDNNIDSFGNFLDDFAVNIFLPQIEDKVTQLLQSATVGKVYYNILLYVLCHHTHLSL